MQNKHFVGEVVDIFCGIGGISHGFKRAGFDIRAGYDLDDSCRYAYETNNDARFVKRDLADVTAQEIQGRFTGTLPTVLVGCAPCQPFSSYKKSQVDDRWGLLNRFAELAVETDADYITMENVSGLLTYKNGTVFDDFMTILSAKYHCSVEIVNCTKFGVPQSRNRLVVTGGKLGEVIIKPRQSSPALTVGDSIRDLAPLMSGEISKTDPLHRCSKLNDINQRRIRNSKPGGTWKDWPPELVSKCHKDPKGKGYRSVYGRMSWDKPAPTMTTQCYGYGNGRFGHPDQDRAISLREAAILQSFPIDYKFFPEEKFPGFRTVGRWIGNAVPVELAYCIAQGVSEEIYNNG